MEEWVRFAFLKITLGNQQHLGDGSKEGNHIIIFQATNSGDLDKDWWQWKWRMERNLRLRG